LKLVVIDGQGGGVGKSLVAALKARMPQQPVIALGTNVQATSAMLRAGADAGATGESAIRYQCKNADVIVGKINVDDEPELAQKFGVMSIPTLIVLRDGKESARSTGARPKAQVQAMLQS
jgi:hypothetical protein